MFSFNYVYRKTDLFSNFNEVAAIAHYLRVRKWMIFVFDFLLLNSIDDVIDTVGDKIWPVDGAAGNWFLSLLSSHR